MMSSLMLFLTGSVPGRSGKQCRERWNDHLDPSINQGEWQHEEDAKLIELQRQLGNKWSEISRSMPGRLPSKIKERARLHER
jgi:hypothetical protein